MIALLRFLRVKIRAQRIFVSLILAMPTLIGCESLFSSSKSTVTAQFAGAVVADEPIAALIARDVLSFGGSAADAAFALYFALAVTHPSMAGLGGGGVCQVFEPATKKRPDSIAVLEFYPETTKILPLSQKAPVAVPTSVRGFFALQARFGRKPFQKLLATAERLARFGVPVSRTFAKDLANNAAFLLENVEAKKIFAASDGQPLRTGDQMIQPDLAKTLSILRTRGVIDFYEGEFSRLLVTRTQIAGGDLKRSDLNNFRPRWTKPWQAELNEEQILFTPPPPAMGGLVIAQTVSALLGEGQFAKRTVKTRPHIFVEGLMRAFLARNTLLNNPTDGEMRILGSSALRKLGKDLPKRKHIPLSAIAKDVKGEAENPAGSSFVVQDTMGQVVACSVTPNNVFGVGVMIPGTGILIAPAPNQKGVTDNSLRSLGPIFIVDQQQKKLYLALAGSGGIGYPSAAAWVILDLWQREPRNLTQALALPRLHHSGAPDLVYIEQNLSNETQKRLAQYGHRVKFFPSAQGIHPGRVNAVYCPQGFPSEESCSAAADPRGNGIAYIHTRDPEEK